MYHPKRMQAGSVTQVFLFFCRHMRDEFQNMHAGSNSQAGLSLESFDRNQFRSYFDQGWGALEAKLVSRCCAADFL